MNNTIRILFTDLDGTLLNTQRTISPVNLNCLDLLEKHHIIRVIATGRSLFSFKRVFPHTVPADYLIFSNGVGIMDLRRQELLYSKELKREHTEAIAFYLQQQQVDFMVHDAVPENHRFIYWGAPDENSDFHRRIELYSDHARRWNPMGSLPERSAQIIAIFPDDLKRFHDIKSTLEDGFDQAAGTGELRRAKAFSGKVEVTRTTSPLDHTSIWMEILPRSVSKGASAAWLCHHLGITPQATVGIGNDYNDISLLDFTEHSYMVANAPGELHGNYRLTQTNDNDGFSLAIQSAMELSAS